MLKDTHFINIEGHLSSETVRKTCPYGIFIQAIIVNNYVQRMCDL